MNEVSVIREMAGVMYSAFEKDTRNISGRDFWRFKDRPSVSDEDYESSWQWKLTYVIHGPLTENGTPEWAPDDYRYDYCVEALSRIMEQEYDSPYNLYQETEHDYDLYHWLASHGFRPGYVDEVLLSDMRLYDGRRRIPTLEDLVGKGQVREKNEVLRMVLDFLAHLDPEEVLGGVQV